MKNTAAFLRNLALSLSIAALGSVATTAHAQAQEQTQQAPQPCSTATTNPSPNSSANNAATAFKNLGSLFKKKPSSQPSNATANPAPCAPAATTPATPGNKNAGQPAGAPQGAGVNFNGPFTPPAGTKVEATLLAPFAPGNTFQVSPHGVHAATLAHSGSRQQIIYDGVAGPVFDSFASNQYQPVSFSPDGNHFGYCGIASEQFSVMVDGKQVGGGPQVNSNYACSVYFSPNSRHFFYTMTATGNGGDTYIRVVFDGKIELRLGDFNPRKHELES